MSSKSLLLLCVFVLFYILTYGTTSIDAADTGKFRTSKPQNETKSIERTSPRVHVVQDTSVSRFAKGGYVGSGPKNIRQQPHSSSRSSSYSIKPSSIFMAALTYLILGLLLITGLF